MRSLSFCLLYCIIPCGPIPLGRGAFNVSNIVQLVEGGCERNKVPIPLGSGAFNGFTPLVGRLYYYNTTDLHDITDNIAESLFTKLTNQTSR